MVLMNKGWDTKKKFYWKNTEAETFILFNKSSKKIWRRMWGENNAIYLPYLCFLVRTSTSPDPHYLRGTWGLRKIAKKGGELRVFIKKRGCKKRRNPAKVGDGAWFFSYFECNAPTSMLTSKLECCSSNRTTPRVQKLQKSLVSRSWCPIAPKYSMDVSLWSGYCQHCCCCWRSLMHDDLQNWQTFKIKFITWREK